MHFALLVSQLPHVDDARAQYGDMLSLARRPYRARLAVLALWSAVKKFVR